MFNLESFFEICSTAYVKAAYSVLVGAVGTVILVAFFNMVVTPAASIKFLPVIIAFNAALTGYMVLEKTRSFFQHKWLIAVISGLAVTLLAFFALFHAHYRPFPDQPEPVVYPVGDQHRRQLVRGGPGH